MIPAELSHSVITPAALAPRNTPEAAQRQQPRESAGASDTQNPQAVLAAGRGELLRAPEPDSGSQRAENQLAASGASSQTGGSEPAGAGSVPQQVPADTGLQLQVDRGLGGNIDITA